LSEKGFLANFGHYDLGTGVARFVDSKLSYLAVSKVESI
jgi:hypothetical protein